MPQEAFLVAAAMGGGGLQTTPQGPLVLLLPSKLLWVFITEDPTLSRNSLCPKLFPPTQILLEYLVVAHAGDPETSPNQLTLENGWHKPTFLVKKGWERTEQREP